MFEHKSRLFGINHGKCKQTGLMWPHLADCHTNISSFCMTKKSSAVCMHASACVNSHLVACPSCWSADCCKVCVPFVQVTTLSTHQQQVSALVMVTCLSAPMAGATCLLACLQTTSCAHQTSTCRCSHPCPALSTLRTDSALFLTRTLQCHSQQAVLGQPPQQLQGQASSQCRFLRPLLKHLLSHQQLLSQLLGHLLTPLQLLQLAQLSLL